VARDLAPAGHYHRLRLIAHVYKHVGVFFQFSRRVVTKHPA
jgi:hypothetical protein